MYKYGGRTLFEEIKIRLNLYLPRWINPWWYDYLFRPWNGWKGVLCRATGHKCGVWFYNPTGNEPNMTCKNCGDDLG